MKGSWPFMDEAESDVLAEMTFPRQHRTTLPGTDPVECLDGGNERRRRAVGSFPSQAAITRLVGALLLEQSDQRAHRTTLQPVRIGDAGNLSSMTGRPATGPAGEHAHRVPAAPRPGT